MLQYFENLIQKQLFDLLLDCKKALSETNGDMDAAIDWLRKKGLAKASKKSGRVASEGLIGICIEDNFGSIVEVNCRFIPIAGLTS